LREFADRGAVGFAEAANFAGLGTLYVPLSGRKEVEKSGGAAKNKKILF
jgi:hypothetical protein